MKISLLDEGTAGELADWIQYVRTEYPTVKGFVVESMRGPEYSDLRLHAIDADNSTADTEHFSGGEVL